MSVLNYKFAAPNLLHSKEIPYCEEFGFIDEVEPKKYRSMPWYVVRTKPQHEIKSAGILEDSGVEVYCPTFQEVRQWSDRKKKVTVPLFKSYIFVNLENHERKRVFEAPGVLNFLFWQREPAIAREEEIEAIKAWMNNDSIDEVRVRELSKGDMVELKAGKFAGEKAMIIETGSKKLKLILPNIGWKLTAYVRDVI